MNKIGFTKSKSDVAVFYRHNGKGFAIIAVAVDNLMITVINDVVKVSQVIITLFARSRQI